MHLNEQINSYRQRRDGKSRQLIQEIITHINYHKKLAKIAADKLWINYKKSKIKPVVNIPSKTSNNQLLTWIKTNQNINNPPILVKIP